MLKDANVFLYFFLWRFAGPWKHCFGPCMHWAISFCIHYKKKLKISLKSSRTKYQNSSFLVLLSGDAGGGSHMGTGLCQVRKPTTFTGRKTSTLFFSTKVGSQIFLVSPQIAQSNNSKAHSAIANPQISECARVTNRKSANLQWLIRKFSWCPSPQIANPQIAKDKRSVSDTEPQWFTSNVFSF